MLATDRRWLTATRDGLGSANARLRERSRAL
jgi:hypothetical protein